MPPAIHSNRFPSDEIAVHQGEHRLRNLGFSTPTAERRETLDCGKLFV